MSERICSIIQTNRTRLLPKPIATFDRLFTLLIIRDHFKGFKWKQINLLLNFTFEAILRIYSNQSLESTQESIFGINLFGINR